MILIDLGKVTYIPITLGDFYPLKRLEVFLTLDTETAEQKIEIKDWSFQRSFKINLVSQDKKKTFIKRMEI